MRSRRRFWWATSLAPGSLIVSGCVTAQTTRPRLDGLPGTIAAQPGRLGLVIAALHGTSDARTDEIVTELGRRTGFGVVELADTLRYGASGAKRDGILKLPKPYVAILADFLIQAVPLPAER